MLIISYDFANNKTRSAFSKFLKKHGRKIQYSVYQIRNSDRVKKKILAEIELRYKSKITKSDSVFIFSVCRSCQAKIARYGIDENLDNAVVYF